MNQPNATHLLSHRPVLDLSQIGVILRNLTDVRYTSLSTLTSGFKPVG